LASLRFSFPPETLSSIRKLAFGAFNQLKTGIANGFSGIVTRIRNRVASNAVERAVNS
jgi:hypothetical protein